MSIKDLFGKTSGKNLTSQEIQNLYDEAESAGYLEEIKKKNERFLPQVDFSSASNFARYGSAERYYVDSITNIYQNYPYDGSRKEKQEWRNNSSQFDLYIFDNIYPKTTGYINLNSSSQQYVTVNGGPNIAPSGKFEDANLYDLATNRESNLGINCLNLGNTVEFWFKGNGSNPSKYPLFDLWNGLNGNSQSRFLIEKNNSGFLLTYKSGSYGVNNAEIVYSANTASWHHYAFAVSSSNNNLSIDFYVDGNFEKNLLTGSSFATIANNSGSVANIGSYRSGSGFVNGSFDEFRFWKEARSPKNISRYWFTNVAGGANTDDSNTELGVYFKFNEGIISTGSVNSIDAVCLDYSGRISNGTIVNYTTAVRNTGSAMEDFSIDYNEPGDPIIFASNPLVEEILETYEAAGSLHDDTNNSSIYKSLPSWITEYAEEKDLHELRNLVQIISSYFDALHIQIENLPKLKDVEYNTDTNPPKPFASKLLSSYGFENLEIFNDVTFLEEILSRSETKEFEKSLAEIKNTIYQNIYNNLTYIYKSKGTEKSLRNLIRCFGVDEELIKINMYANNTVYEFSDKFVPATIQKKFVDFNDADRFEGTVYQKNVSGDSNTRGYILGNYVDSYYIPITLQTEIIFPKKVNYDNPNYVIPEFTNVSLFGMHSVTGDENDFSWNGTDSFNFQVYAVKRNKESPDVYFKLVTNGFGLGGTQEITSSYFKDVYDNFKWNIAVRIKPQKYENADFVSGSSIGDYVLEFVGFNSIFDSVDNSFYLTASLPEAGTKSAILENKKLYVGAHYNNFTGSLLSQTDVKISSTRLWLDYLTDEEITYHSYDAASIGRKYPNWNAFPNHSNGRNFPITKNDTLILNWDFDQLTGSDTNGQFLVEDASSGSISYAQEYGIGWFGNIGRYRHTGFGDNFYPNDSQTFNKEYVFSAKQQNPETLAGSDLIQIRDIDDVTVTKNTKPVTFYFSIEKSMNQVINDEIMTWFATISDFNNLIGEPINRYTRTYKGLDHLKTLFFKKVQNEPDFERFLEFYKWIDSSISLMIAQLIPASANVSDKVRNIVESHLLERNKYENKLPTIEFKGETVATFNSNVNTPSYQDIFAPNSPAGVLWQKQRAQRDVAGYNTPLEPQNDVDRELLRQVINSKNLNKVPRFYDVKTNDFYVGKKDSVRFYSSPYKFVASKLEMPSSAINPINIENNSLESVFRFANETLTGSDQILPYAKKQGNYKNTYEYVQTSGRKANNLALPDILDIITGSNVPSIFGISERALPDRKKVKSVLVERFSAPGGPEVSGRGSLDAAAEEYSVYNGLNNRNLVVRRQLNKWLAESASYNENSPSLHKVQKNGNNLIDFDGSGYRTRYDNEFITHQIPRSDTQYSWITASLEISPSASGYVSQYDNINAYTANNFAFSSASIINDQIIDFVGLNTVITKSVNLDANTISSPGISGNLNTYLSNLNGPYRASSWKQIRGAENKLVVESKKQNKILIQDPPEEKSKLEFDRGTGKFYLVKYFDRNQTTFKTYKEPPVAFNKPMKHKIKVSGSLKNVEMVSTYENNKERFSNEQLAKITGIGDKQNLQAHDILLNLEKGNLYNPKIEIAETEYDISIYPRKDLVGLKESRVKTVYEDNIGNTGSIVDARTFWRDLPDNRARVSGTLDLFKYNTNTYDSLENVLFKAPYNVGRYDGFSILKHNNKIRDSILAQDSISSSISSSKFFNSQPPDAPEYTYGLAGGFAHFNTTTKKLIDFRVNTGSIYSRNMVYISAVYSASSGLYLAAGGNDIGVGFGTIGNSNSRFAKWNELKNSWENVGNIQLGASETIYAIASSSNGLYVGGSFQNLNGDSALDYLARYNPNGTWTGFTYLGSPLSSEVRSLVSSSEGIYVGGFFQKPFAAPSGQNGLLRLKPDDTFAEVGQFNTGQSSDGKVTSIASGSGYIYVIGQFPASGSYNAYSAKYDGTSWSALTSSQAMLMSSGSSGLYIVLRPFGPTSDKIVRYNGGTSWTTLIDLMGGLGNYFGIAALYADNSSNYYWIGNGVDSNRITKVHKNGYEADYPELSLGSNRDLVYFDDYFYAGENSPSTYANEIIYPSDQGLFIAGGFDYIGYTGSITEDSYNTYNIKGYLSDNDLTLQNYFNKDNISYRIDNVASYDIEENNIYNIRGIINKPEVYGVSGSEVTTMHSTSQGVYVAGNTELVFGNSVYQSFLNYDYFNSSIRTIGLWDGANWKNVSNYYENIFPTSSYTPLAYIRTILSASEGIYLGYDSYAQTSDTKDDSLILFKSGSFSESISGIMQRNSGRIYDLISSSQGVYIAGYFADTGSQKITGSLFTKWNGTTFNPISPAGIGFSGPPSYKFYVKSMASGSEGIYLGGYFRIPDTETANGTASYGITLYNDLGYFALGTSSIPTPGSPALTNNTLDPIINKVISGSDGVYICGQFVSVGESNTRNNLAKWDGARWTTLGVGIEGAIKTMVSLSSGLYVGGAFSKDKDGNTLNNLARWDGQAWTYLGASRKRNGIRSSINDSVDTMIVNGENILIGGSFNTIAGGPIIKDKKYDNYFEAYRPSGSLIFPKPQLIFNNFIPPYYEKNSLRPMRINLAVYDSSSQVVAKQTYKAKEYFHTLNGGYIYEVNEASNNKPFFDSYEDFADDFKNSSQRYALVPEYRISDYMESFVKEANGDFTRILTNDYLKLEGLDTTAGFNDINNSLNRSQRFSFEILGDDKKDKDRYFSLKLSAIKKLLPYKGFYPSERVVTLSNYFIKSFLGDPKTLRSVANKENTFTSFLSNGTPVNQQVLTLLQPLFAPGILLNTIKSSLAVDFPTFIANSGAYDSEEPPSFYAHTGSALITGSIYSLEKDRYYSYTGSNYIDKPFNFRFPFESLIEFDTIVPNEFKNSENNLYYLNPTHLTTDFMDDKIGSFSYPSYNMGSGSLKSFFFVDSNYKLAMHNFLAEIPNFFLRGGLTNIASSPIKKINAKYGTNYYMDVVLEKSNNYKEFMADPYLEQIKNNSATLLKRVPSLSSVYTLPSTDSLYGPPVRYWNSVSCSTLFEQGQYNLFSKLLDTPAYAPYVPPYYYGKQIARISFLADKTGSSEYTLEEIFDRAEVENISPETEKLFLERSSYLLGDNTLPYTPNYSDSPAFKERMTISSSLNLFLASEIKNTSFDAQNSTINTVSDADSETKTFSWTIQTKFETPSINFIDCDLTKNIGLKVLSGSFDANNAFEGYFQHLFKGMWTTYGNPVKEGEGISIYLQESFKGSKLPLLSKKVTRTNNTGSLITLCGFKTDEKKTVGLLAENKIVSEGVVMIPYTFNKNHGLSFVSSSAETLDEIVGENLIVSTKQRGNGPYYFKIDRNILTKVIGLSFDNNSKVTFEEIKAKVESAAVDQNNSIVKLVKEMTRFVIPPHLDWLRNKKIDPFVMYIIPFSVSLDKEDLSNIWQGVMPKPSLITEQEEKTINHKMDQSELFHGKDLPSDLTFKTFKVKQKANVNYYKLTSDSKDDTRFKFNFKNTTLEPEYSYNYPYDFFSIVELVNIEAGAKATEKTPATNDEKQKLTLEKTQIDVRLSKKIGKKGK